MATMTAEEQNACLEKILSGEIKGTIQDIQDFKSSKAETSEEIQENSTEEISDTTEKSVGGCGRKVGLRKE